MVLDFPILLFPPISDDSVSSTLKSACPKGLLFLFCFFPVLIMCFSFCFVLNGILSSNCSFYVYHSVPKHLSLIRQDFQKLSPSLSPLLSKTYIACFDVVFLFCFFVCRCSRFVRCRSFFYFCFVFLFLSLFSLPL